MIATPRDDFCRWCVLCTPPMLKTPAIMLNEQSIRDLLTLVARRERTVDAALDELRCLPYEDLDFARIDHHRALRRGCGEVIYCAGKTPAQVAEIAAAMVRRHPRLLGTRAGLEHYAAVEEAVDGVQY